MTAEKPESAKVISFPRPKIVRVNKPEVAVTPEMAAAAAQFRSRVETVRPLNDPITDDPVFYELREFAYKNPPYREALYEERLRELYAHGLTREAALERVKSNRAKWSGNPAEFCALYDFIAYSHRDTDKPPSTVEELHYLLFSAELDEGSVKRYLEGLRVFGMRREAGEYFLERKVDLMQDEATDKETDDKPLEFYKALFIFLEETYSDRDE